MVKIEKTTALNTNTPVLKPAESNKPAAFITVPLAAPTKDFKKDLSFENNLFAPQKLQEKAALSLPDVKKEELKEINYLKEPEMPDYSKQIMSFDPEVEPYMSDLDKAKRSKEALILNTWEASKKTGLSQNFIDRLSKTEGHELEAYRCEAGYLTIGYGHNIDADPNYRYGKKITEEVAVHLFTKDLINAQKQLKEMLGGQKLERGQEEALVDIIFNMGAEGFSNTKLLALVKEKKFEEATKEFTIVRAGKKVSAGLCLRRIENIQRFCGEKPSMTAINSMKKIQKLGSAAAARKRGRGLRAKMKQMSSIAFFKRESNYLINKTTALYNTQHPGKQPAKHVKKR